MFSDVISVLYRSFPLYTQFESKLGWTIKPVEEKIKTGLLSVLNLDMSQSFKVQISGHDATVYASSYMQFGNKLPSKVSGLT